MPDPTRPVPLLERKDLTPVERARIGRVVSALLGVGLIAISALGSLAIWHLVRRGRLIRERLGSPRVAPLPDLKPGSGDPPAPASS